MSPCPLVPLSPCPLVPLSVIDLSFTDDEFNQKLYNENDENNQILPPDLIRLTLHSHYDMPLKKLNGDRFLPSGLKHLHFIHYFDSYDDNYENNMHVNKIKDLKFGQKTDKWNCKIQLSDNLITWNLM